MDSYTGAAGEPEPKLPAAASKADKRAHHNALERKRRDHIKDSFTVLRDSIPTIQGEKSSRAQILNKSTEYIKSKRADVESLQAQLALELQQNEKLAAEVATLGAGGGAAY